MDAAKAAKAAAAEAGRAAKRSPPTDGNATMRGDSIRYYEDAVRKEVSRLRAQGVAAEEIAMMVEVFEPGFVYHAPPIASQTPLAIPTTTAPATSKQPRPQAEKSQSKAKSAAAALMDDAVLRKYAKVVKITRQPPESVAQRMGRDGVTQADIERFLAAYKQPEEAKSEEVTPPAPAAASSGSRLSPEDLKNDPVLKKYARIVRIARQASFHVSTYSRHLTSAFRVQIPHCSLMRQTLGTARHA